MSKNKTTNTVKRWNVRIVLLIVSAIIFSCTASAAHSHSWSKWQHNNDIHWKVCSTCGEYKQVETHTLYVSKKVNATCTKNGYVLYKCKCGYKCKKILKASKAHKYDAGRITVSPTCCKQGKKVCTCKLCGKTKEVILAPNDNHSYNSGVVIVNATCYSTGTKRYTCTACGKTKDEVIPKNNAHTARYWQCNEYGHWLNCDYCGVLYKSEYHNFDDGVITSDNGNSYVVTYTCNTCGYKKYETKNKTCTHTSKYWYYDINNHWLTCDKCGTKYSSSNHNFDNGVITSNGANSYVVTYTCKTCGYKKDETKTKTCSHTSKYWYCDDTGHWLTCDKCGTKYNFSAHNYDNTITSSDGKKYCGTCGYCKEVNSASSTGSMYIVFNNGNVHKGDLITFTIKYSGVNSLQNLKLYLDGVEATSSILKLVSTGDHSVTYSLNTSSLNKGNVSFNFKASNCTEVATSLTIN